MRGRVAGVAVLLSEPLRDIRDVTVRSYVWLFVSDGLFSLLRAVTTEQRKGRRWVKTEGKRPDLDVYIMSSSLPASNSPIHRRRQIEETRSSFLTV